MGRRALAWLCAAGSCCTLEGVIASSPAPTSSSSSARATSAPVDVVGMGRARRIAWELAYVTRESGGVMNAATLRSAAMTVVISTGIVSGWTGADATQDTKDSTARHM